MEKNWKVSRSSSSLIPKKYGRFSAVRDSREEAQQIKPIRSMKSIRINRQHTLQDRDYIFSKESTPEKLFKPSTRSYVQLVSAPTFFQFNSKQVQKDKISLSKIINIDQVIRKSNEIHSQLKALITKSSNKMNSNAEEMIQASTRKEKLKLHPFRAVFFREIKAGSLEKIAALVKKYPELVHEVDSTEQTALHWACRRGFTDIAKLLLEAGARPGAADLVGRRPEDIARSKDRADILALLAISKRRSGFSVLYSNQFNL